MTVLLHRRTSTDSTTGSTDCTVLLRLVVLLHEVHGGVVEEGGVVDGPDKVQMVVLILSHSEI